MRRRFSIVASVGVVATCLALALPARSDPSDRAVVVEGENAMGVSLLRALRAANPSDNLVVSPFTVAQTVEALAAASRGATRSELLATLHLPSRVSLARALEASRNLREELGGSIRLTALVVSDPAVKITPAFSQLAKDTLDQTMLARDLTDAETVRNEINNLVAGLTDRLVNQLLESVPKGDAKLLVGGAFGFRADWQSRLAEEGELAFRRSDGRTVNARKLTTGPGGIGVSFLKRPDSESVVIPYRGSRLAFVIILPAPGKLASVEQSLSASSIFDTLLLARRRTVAIDLPAFEFGTRIEDLAALMAPFGARSVFVRGRADLSGMTPAKGIAVDHAVEQSVVTVDSGGTDTAPTAPIRGGTADLSMSVNRPFLFAVVDRPTGALLELGRVIDPTQS